MRTIADIYTFKRVEKKYRVTAQDKENLLSEIGDHLIPDSHGKSTICSLYLDTPDFLLIRNSIAARTYKEKLRIRSYGTPDENGRVFFEIKKKFKGVVYKRRVSMTLAQAENYIEHGLRPEESQIMSEIDYAMGFYRQPKPRMLIAYERDAFYVKDMPNLRITFDSNIRYRQEDLFLEHGNKGKTLLPEDVYIMEVKTDGAMPLWLSHALAKCEILPSSFSKYGTAYNEQLAIKLKNIRERTSADSKDVLPREACEYVTV